MKNLSLSANALFHFTNSMENIESILKNEFYPNYSLEVIQTLDDEKDEFAIPMVCFCDIPLSQTQAHTTEYGNYAIGLSKAWGIKNNINPVLYTYKDARVVDFYTKMASQIDPDNFDNAIIFNSFIKPYEGKLWDKKKKKYKEKLIRFYDEREWRFVPTIDVSKDKIFPLMGKSMFLDDTVLNTHTDRLKNKKLSFEPNDIKSIIVSKESEILDMFEKVKRIKGHKYKPNDIKILQTRIISMEHIRENF